VSGVDERMPVMLGAEVIRCGDKTETDSNLWIVVLPKMRCKQGHEGNAQQQGSEWNDGPKRRQRDVCGRCSEDVKHG
jgi:hypothetical protein